MKVYLAGPMRGYPLWNFPAFDAAEKRWREAGHEVYSPADLNRGVGIDPAKLPAEKLEEMSQDRVYLRQVILADVLTIVRVDAVVLLEGWEVSMGAAVEVALAQFLGLPLYSAATMELLSIDTTPYLDRPVKSKNPPRPRATPLTEEEVENLSARLDTAYHATRVAAGWVNPSTEPLPLTENPDASQDAQR